MKDDPTLQDKLRVNRRGFFGAIAAALGCARGHTQGIHSAEPLKELDLANLRQALDEFAAMRAEAVEVLRPTLIGLTDPEDAFVASEGLQHARSRLRINWDEVWTDCERPPSG